MAYNPQNLNGQATKVNSSPIVIATEQETILNNIAKDGTDITTPTAMPTGGVGIRGWLSSIWTKLNGSLAVTGSFFQATQPVSAQSLPLPTGAATATNQQTNAITDDQIRATALPVTNASLPLPTGASTEATLALIKAKTDNLDVALSTRAVTGLTDAQIRATALPVSGQFVPLNTSVTGTLTASDVVVAAPDGIGTILTGTSTTGSVVYINMPDGFQAWTLMIKGFVSGFIYTEASINTTNGIDGDWIDIKGRKTGTVIGVESVTYAQSSNGVYRGNAAGFKAVRARLIGGTGVSISFLLSNGMGATFLNSGIPTGGSIIGKVGIDQTTPGTTNLVQSILQNTAGVSVEARPDGFLKAQIDPTTLLYDTFENLDTTNTWVIGGTTLPVGSAGSLILTPGTVANGTSYAKSQPVFTPASNAYLQYAALIQLEVGVVTGNKRLWGLGIYTIPTFAVPITNGVVYEINDTTGALQGAVYSNSVRTSTVAMIRPTDGLVHRYSIYYKGSRAYFDFDNVVVGSIAFPALQVSALSTVAISLNGATTVGSSPTFNSSLIGVADTGRNSNKISDGTYAWRTASVGKNGGLSIKGSTIVGQSTNFAAAATGNTTGLDVSEAGNVLFVIKNTIAASPFGTGGILVFEQSDDNVSWGTLPVVRMDSNIVSTTHTLGSNLANNEFQFNTAMLGGAFVRVRVTTAVTTNSMTVAIYPGGLAFTPYTTVVNGNAKPTYRSATSTLLTTAVTANVPFFIIQGSSTKTIKIQRIIISGIVTTAVGYVQINLGKYSTAPTAGTALALTKTPLDSLFPASTANLVQVYTAAPTAGTKVGDIGVRRSLAQSTTAAAGGIPEEIIFNFLDGDATIPPALRGITEGIGLYWQVAPATAPSLEVQIEWTEE